MSRERAVGIDLGTTFSAASWVDESGRTAMIRNGEGDLLTPSVVLFTDREVVVGKEARTATVVHPDLVAEWVKRDMGLPYYSHPIHGQKLPPEVIQACILRKLKQDVVRALGSVDRVVITVPAYFDEPRRKSTSDAGEMAGLKVLDIVNEPTAAALAFGETLGYLSPDAAPQKEMTIFVYDLGGGTFDATLLRLAPGNIQTIATDGDVQLGGHDWDMRMAEYVADEFRKANGMDPRKDPAAMNRVLSAVIDAKHTLSARSRAIIRVTMGERSMDVPVTREQFEEMTIDLLERTAYTTRQLLTAAKMQWKDVTRLLLVGGSTRMPAVVNMLRKMSGMEPDHTVNPDEAVARGAALYASYLLAKEAGGGTHAHFSITNVNSHSLGVEGIDPETFRKKNVILIPRNSPLPAKATERFVTKTENQRSIALQVLEGESLSPGECTAIGRTVIRDLPDGLPKNWPIEVTFLYAANGRLTVHGMVPGTHQEATLDIERTVGMSSDGIDHWKQPIAEAAGFNAFESMVQEVLQLSANAAAGASTGVSGVRLAPSMGSAEPSQLPAGEAAPLKPRRQGWTPFAASPDPQDAVQSAVKFTPQPAPIDPAPIEATDAEAYTPPSMADRAAEEKSRRGRHWAVNLVGHVIAAVVGLAVGYLILKALGVPLPSLFW